MARLLRRGLIVFLLVLLGLAAVALVRTANVSPPPVPTASLAPPVIDALPAAHRLAASLRFRTISREDRSRLDRGAFVALNDYLRTAFPLVHRSLGSEPVNDLSLLYRWTGSDPSLPPLLLLAHLDVVPADPPGAEAWTHPPFAGAISEGYVWGRGAMDMKVAALGALEAIERLLEERFEPRRTVMLAFGHDEEVGGDDGGRAIAGLLRERGIRPAFILDEGMAIVQGAVPGISRPVAFVGVAEKGYVSVELVAQGQGGHSSMPPANTAVGVVASAIESLQTHPFPIHLDGPTLDTLEFLAPEMPFSARLAIANLWLFKPVIAGQLDREPATRALIRTTMAPTMFEGSVKDNILPVRARAVVNLRVHPAERVATAVDRIERTISDPRVTVRILEGAVSEPSPTSPVDVQAFTLLHRTIVEVFPDVTVAPTLTLGATDSRHYTQLGGPIYRFLPLRLALEDTVRIHGIDERIAVENYGEVIGFYMNLIRNADSADL